ncbi:MAG: restriction endonuclease subunit S [Acidobacteria bacterium]|nr:restriction endonuclease subunit S [Acidobacteriota bacterium]
MTAEQRGIVLSLLGRYLPETETWAYGSRVEWSARPQSDLDLVVFASPEERRQVVALREALEESDLPFRVDLFIWDQVPQSFRERIRAKHVVLRAPSEARWPMVPVACIAEKVAMGPFGSSIKVDTFVPRGVPIINGRHLHGSRVDDSPGFNFITEEHAKKLARANVRRGDIVFTHRGTIGQVAYVPQTSEFDRYVVSQSQFYLRCDRSTTIPEFVAMYFQSPEGQSHLLANSSQVGVPSIAQPVTYLRNLRIPCPPRAEQSAIAHILGTLDDKIELNRRANHTLEAIARALFKSWFVDFDPVRAKMEGRDTGLPQVIADLFPDRLVDSDMGTIPAGWEATSLGSVIEVYDRKRVPLNRRQRAERQGPYPYYGAAGVMDHVDDYLFDGVHILTGEDGSVVDARGYPVVQYVWGRFWVNNHAHVLKGRDGISDEHLYLLLQSTNISAFVTGAVQPKLNQRNLKSIPVVVPTLPVRHRFSDLVSRLFGMVRRNTDESKLLASLRDTLLPKLVSGEIRVPEAASALECVT